MLRLLVFCFCFRSKFGHGQLALIQLTPSGARFGDTPIGDDGVDALRTRWSIEATTFQAALIGKDGRVKDRWTQPFEPGEMTALIDTMPMRQDEMRRSGTD